MAPVKAIATKNSACARRPGGVPASLSTALALRLSLGTFLVAIALWSAACNGGDGTAPASPTGDTATPSPSPSPTTPGTPAISADTVVDLATAEPLLTIIGANVGDFESDLGALTAGDFNGDGFADVLTGARFGDGPDEGREDAGEAYVIFGSSDPPPTVDLARGEQDITIWGESAGDGLGIYVAAADLDGDGLDDIVVGAPFATSATVEGGETGKAYVIYGKAGLPSTIDLADGEQDVTLMGATSPGFFGDSLAIGDVNGDEAADLIVGATFESHAPSGSGSVKAGSAYVIYGGRRWPQELEMAAEDYDAVIFGAEEFDELGDNVASGDLNADDFDDVVITAEAADGPDNAKPLAAEVDVVFGSESLREMLRIAAGDQDVSVLGAKAQDTLGFALAAGDVDGDGIDDIAMGARLADGPTSGLSGAGNVYVLFGSRDPPSLVDLAEAPSGVSLYYGADGSDFLGGSLEAGDVDGDDTIELIVGAPFGDGPANSRSGAGDVYVIANVEREASASITAVPLTVVVYGAAEGDKLGAALATGDFNADGLDELLLVASEADGPDGGPPDVGRVYVLSLGD